MRKASWPGSYAQHNANFDPRGLSALHNCSSEWGAIGETLRVDTTRLHYGRGLWAKPADLPLRCGRREIGGICWHEAETAP